MYNKENVKERIIPVMEERKNYLLGISLLIVGYCTSFQINILPKYIFYIACVLSLANIGISMPNFIKCCIDYIKMDIVSIELQLEVIITNHRKGYTEKRISVNEKGRIVLYDCFYEFNHKPGDIVKISYLKRSRIIIDSELILENAEREKLTRKQRTGKIT